MNTIEILDNISSFKNKIHIRVIERTKKKITIIENIPSDINLKLLLSFLKKTFNCSGTIVEDNNNILQFSGDNRYNFKNFLIKENICEPENIILHKY
tara:strand:- start:171 stop:461 length:291 start_codon:yes stop_codon:yes gene_type:complete